MNAPGATQLAQLKAAGFSPDEQNAWIASKAQTLTAGGFTQDEIATYFGNPPVDPSPFRDYFNGVLAEVAATPEAGGQGQPAATEGMNLDQAFQAGFQNSVTGLAARQRVPEIVLENTTMGENIAAMAGQTAGDLPAMFAGAFIGGAAGGGIGSAVTATGGAFAFPAALRKLLMETYANGQIKTPERFWEVASATFLDAATGYLTGAATAGAGLAAGAAGAPVAAKLSAEIGTMVTVGAGLEGRLPTVEEFATAGIFLAGAKGAGWSSRYLRDLYANKGVTPTEVARDAMVEPSIREDAASVNLSTPRVYRTGDEAERLDAELVRVRELAAKVAPEALEGVQTLDTPTGRIMSRLSIDEPQPKPGYNFDKFYSAWIDKLHPIQKAVEAMAKGADLETVADAYKLARMEGATAAKADHFLRYGTFDLDGNRTGGSLKAALAPVADKLDSLRVYLTARRSVELADRGIETGVDTADARAVVSSLGAKFGPVAEKLDAFQHDTLKYFQKSGMLSQDQVAAMSAANRSYVPFYRAFEDAAGGGPSPGKSPNVFQTVKRIQGSTEKIVDPLESIVKNTYTLIQMAERNRVHRAFVELAEKSENGSEYATREKAKSKPIELSAEERTKLVESVLGGGELTPEQATALDESFAVFRKNAVKAGKDQIALYRDGKPEVWNVTPEVYEAFSAGDSASANTLMKWLSKPASLLRAGSVLSPEFMARNPVRDQFSAFLFTHAGFKPFLDMARGMAHVIGRDEVYQEWLRSGGPMSALQSLDRQYLQQNVRGLMEETNLRNSARNVLLHPIEMLRAVAEVGENATRVGEFKASLAKGASLQEAGFQSREVSVDFARSGSVGQQWNRVIAFWNAQVQGADKMARMFAEKPAQTTAKVIAGITLPSVLLYLHNRDEPGFDEIPQWQKDLFWVFPTGSGQDRKWWRVPKPFEVGIIFGSGAERVAEYVLEKDPKAFDGWLASLGRGMAPGVVPTGLLPLAEAYFNKSVFMDRPIVPANREKMLPEYRYQPYTTELTKAVARSLAQVPGLKHSDYIAPAIIDNSIRGWTGGLGVHLVNLANKALTVAGVLPERADPTDTLADIPFIKAFAIRTPSAGSESIAKFYERYAQEAETLYTIKQLAKEGDPASALREFQIAGGSLVNLDMVQKTLSGRGALIRAIYRNPSLSPDEKRQLIDQNYELMIGTAKLGNQMLDNLDAMREKALAKGLQQ